MKFQPDRSDAPLITRYGPGWIELGDPATGRQKIHGSCLLAPEGLRQAWDCTGFDDLTAAHFAQVAALQNIELVVFGSGSRLRFVPPAWLAALMARRIGIETMDTPAACRTYNFLVSEGRKVAGALLIEPAVPSEAG